VSDEADDNGHDCQHSTDDDVNVLMYNQGMFYFCFTLNMR